MVEPAVLASLAAVSRVSRALVAPDELPVLGAAALEEMREALHLDRAVLYLPDADGQPVLRRFVGDQAAAELSFDEEAWRLATGAPIVLRVAFKPTSSVPLLGVSGRHDPCVAIRGAPVIEAMMALVLADHKLLHRGQCG